MNSLASSEIVDVCNRVIGRYFCAACRKYCDACAVEMSDEFTYISPLPHTRLCPPTIFTSSRGSSSSAPAAHPRHEMSLSEKKHVIDVTRFSHGPYKVLTATTKARARLTPVNACQRMKGVPVHLCYRARDVNERMAFLTDSSCLFVK